MAELILDIPFDEPDGSTVAYDYGPGAHHAAIEAGRFIPGKFNNCVYFPGEGKAEIIPQVINFAADFSVESWVKAESTGEGSMQSFVIFKFPGINNEISIDLHSSITYWQHFVATQKGEIISVFLDGKIKGTFTRPFNMTGFALVNDNGKNTAGYCSLDSTKVYDYALTVDQIDDNINQTLQPVDFLINNVNLRDLGVVIERIDGILDMPGRKNPLTFDWDDYHGEVVDLTKPVLDVREIELGCWLKASTQDELVSKWLQVRSIFEAPGTQRLQINAGSKPLLYDVYHAQPLKAKNKWRNTGPYHLRFDLLLREPEPVKRILKVTGNSVSISLTSRKLLSISWGDGSKTYNVYGTGVTLNHSYSGGGDKYVVISGNIEDITGFSTNAIVLHNRI